jgi:hypothetical protein
MRISLSTHVATAIELIAPHHDGKRCRLSDLQSSASHDRINAYGLL